MRALERVSICIVLSLSSPCAILHLVWHFSLHVALCRDKCVEELRALQGAGVFDISASNTNHWIKTEKLPFVVR